DFTDSFGGYTIEVDQVEWGHVARKRTWLYLVGVPREALEAPPFPGREPTHWITGWRGRAETRNRTLVPPGIKTASAAQRRRTPPLFAGYLVRLARSVAASRAAPYDDEPLSEVEARELDEARAEVERGEVVSHEEVRRLWLKQP